ncbi:MFS transporter [Streptomyces winkii]|uniref:MFS transporter n=1 Tax=Streptomyces winkii TaxID=3051178 RepID=UPI0028D5DFF5|nr:MFS transporter [Streptomyces sp. DSM 40971]
MALKSDVGERSRRPRDLGRRGSFFAAAATLALSLWSSGAPSVLYPLYAEAWDLTPLVVTSVFATFPVALIVTMTLLGDLSDAIGRRRVMMWGVVLIAASAGVFAVAPAVSFLFVGRVLQGVGAGLAMGAASAALWENNISSNPRLASSVATVSTSTGLTLALALSGALAQFAPLPLVWSYIVLLVLAVATVGVLAAAPDDRGANVRRWRPRPLRPAPGIRHPFAIATLSVALAYCMGAVFLSLGAHMIRQFAQTDDLFVIGVLLACSSAAIGVTGLFLGRVPAYRAARIGAVSALVSLVLMALVAGTGSIVLLLAWCCVGGAAYSFAFTGGLGVINHAAPGRHRGATLSLLYLFAYLLQAGTAVGVGALATAFGLGIAITAAAAFLTLICLTVLTLARTLPKAERSK